MTKFLNPKIFDKDVEQVPTRDGYGEGLMELGEKNKDVVVLTGDFNTGLGTAPYEELTGVLTDAWKVAAEKTGPEGTFHGFKGTPGAARIDWILISAPWKVSRMATVDDGRPPLYPSDHYGVLAVFETR